MKAVFEELSRLIDEQLNRLRTLFRQDLQNFNELVREEQIPPIAISEI